MKKILFTLILLLTLGFAKSAYDYVNPFIGTDEMGHVYPGATVPFGMVQLSPETDSLLYTYGKGYNPDIYQYCSGYQYKDNTITGFSHTHFSGTGHSDLGDFLIMATTGEVKLNPGTTDNPETGYRSRFSHENESAKPGWYSVKLEDYNIQADLTATERVGIHQYTFPKNEQANIILDMVAGIYDYDGKVVWSSIRIENDTLVTGYRQTNGWATDRFVYFAMSFSQPMQDYGVEDGGKYHYRPWWVRSYPKTEKFPHRSGTKLKAWFKFDTKSDNVVKVKFALSSVGTAGALKNLRAEAKHWDFDRYKKAAIAKWEKELDVIEVKADKTVSEVFYTSLYHSLISPTIYMDVDGQYKGIDGNVHKADNFTNYSTFSLWDTYRALHPLFTIIEQERTTDMVNSMLAHYEQSVHKILPIWSHHGNENWCMIGYHGVPVVADALMKDMSGFDKDKAFEAVVSSANFDEYAGIGDYKKYGYAPDDKTSSAASKTLEYAYDDWTIYKMAEKLGKSKEATEYEKRANSYKALYDKETGFLRSKRSDGTFRPNFNSMATGGQGYIEGNAWNYSLYIPQDIKGFVNLIGGNEVLEKWLDTLFVMEVSDEDIAHSEDVEKSGMIGNYVHGNEPSHHVIYMYNWIDKPWKAQEKVRYVLEHMYRTTPDGVSGNDDCGQMSAWYIFSALGFYPVAPGSNEYVIGSPNLKSAKINMDNGKTFEIEVKNQKQENVYIQSVELNGKEYKKNYITHADIISGGKMVYKMGSTPNYLWGIGAEAHPYSLTK